MSFLYSSPGRLASAAGFFEAGRIVVDNQDPFPYNKKLKLETPSIIR
jgi:hypothetical protein